MFAVVGCRECGAFWIVKDHPETTGCPRCGTRHDFSQLKKFVQTEEEEHAREIRARLLAEQSGYGERYADVGSFGELADGDDERGPREFVDARLLRRDPAERGTTNLGDQGASRPREILLAAIRELDDPTEHAIIGHARKYGVSTDQCRDQLETLVESGIVLVHNEQYSLA